MILIITLLREVCHGSVSAHDNFYRHEWSNLVVTFMIQLFGDDFPGGNFPGGSFPGAIFLEGNFLGGNFPRIVSTVDPPLGLMFS